MILTPKILVNRMRGVFSIICLFLAMYMTLTQIRRYLENRDASSIDYKLLGLSTEEQYPTFSLCFKGPEMYWYYESLILKNFDLTSNQFDLIFKGENGAGYKYNYNSKLYDKVRFNVENVTNIGFEQKWYLNLSEILTGVEFTTDNPDHGINYGNGKKGKKVRDAPFYVGFQSPDTICFTRKSDDEPGSIRLTDLVNFDQSKMRQDIYKNVEFQVFIHYPGQLVRSFDTAALKAQFSGIDWTNDRKIQISQIVIFRKRPDSNHPCDQGLHDDDLQMMIRTIQEIGCIPIYWKDLIPKDVHFLECRSKLELQKAYYYVNHFKEIQELYYPPCVSMKTLATYTEITPDYTGGSYEHSGWVRFEYSDKYYQEIKNIQEFGFESFWSAVGGFVGIFMGYSILQLPDLFAKLPALFRQVRSKLYKNT